MINQVRQSLKCSVRKKSLTRKIEQNEAGKLELWAGEISCPVTTESTGSILSQNRYRRAVL